MFAGPCRDSADRSPDRYVGNRGESGTRLALETALTRAIQGPRRPIWQREVSGGQFIPVVGGELGKPDKLAERRMSLYFGNGRVDAV
jgi:hypothetical protein